MEITDPQLRRIAQEMEIKECTERAIVLCKAFTTQLEGEKAMVRCLVAYSMDKAYERLFPRVYWAMRKLGI